MKRQGTSPAALLLAAALLLPAPAHAADFPPSVGQRIANAKSSINTVDLVGLASMYDRKDYGLLIDVRDPDGCAAGHVPGAINVSRGRLELSIWKHVGGPDRPDYSRKMTLYCGTGIRCALAAQTLWTSDSERSRPWT